MSASFDLPSILDRFANGTYTDTDQATLRRAIKAGSVSVEGDVTDSIIITGHGNEVKIEKGPSLDTFRELLQEFFAKEKATPEFADLINVPKLPPHYLPRTEDLNAIKHLLLGPKSKPVAELSPSQKVGIHGMGGIGKSVLAAAVALDDDVRRAFPDGVIWVTLGQSPQLTIRQSQVANALGEKQRYYDDIQQGKSELSQLMFNRACLLILDDVWEVSHIEAFDGFGPQSQILITTRDVDINIGVGAKFYSLSVLSDKLALDLLANWSGHAVGELPSESSEVARECGNLPLALSMIGAMAQGKPDRWDNIIHKLRSADLERIQQQFLDYPYPNLLRAIQVSVDALEADLRELYLDFAVFPENTQIPESVFYYFWASKGLDKYGVQDVLDIFVERSLVNRDDKGNVFLHDLLTKYVKGNIRDRAALHNQLLDSYRSHCQNGWHKLIDDDYLIDFLAYHLNNGNQKTELLSACKDFRYLVHKIHLRGAYAAASDLKIAIMNYPDDYQIKILSRIINNIAHLLNRCDNPKDIVGNLYSRIAHFEELTNIADTWKAEFPTPYLSAEHELPDIPSPALARVLKGHTSDIFGLAISPDNKWIASGSRDKSLIIWNTQTGAEKFSIEQFTSTINSCSFSPDNTFLVATSGSSTIGVWNLLDGNLKFPPMTHSGVNSCAVNRDGSQIITTSNEGTIKFWDTKSGRELPKSITVENSITSLSRNHNHNWILIGLENGNLNLYDLNTGNKQFTIFGHEGKVDNCEISQDGNWLISVSGSPNGDDSIRVWNANNGNPHLSIKLKGPVSCTISPDNQRFAFGTDGGGLAVGNLINGAKQDDYIGHQGAIWNCKYTQDGKFLVSASSDHTLRIWDAKMSSSDKYEEPVLDCLVAPSNNWILSTLRFGQLRTLDAQTNSILNTVRTDSDSINSIDISKNEHLIAFSFSDTWTLFQSGIGKKGVGVSFFL